jgi:hypothetical protein
MKSGGKHLTATLTTNSTTNNVIPGISKRTALLKADLFNVAEKVDSMFASFSSIRSFRSKYPPQ